MNLTFNVLGVTLASVRLDIEREFSPAAAALVTPPQTTVLDKGIKAMSRWWVGGMVR